MCSDRRLACDQRRTITPVSYDLAVWEGERPDGDIVALGVYEELMDRWQEGDAAEPTSAIVAYVHALLERWPDISTEEGEDSPWADGPLLNNASGPIVYFAMVWSRAEDASAYAAELAAAHGLVCFDPQMETVRP